MGFRPEPTIYNIDFGEDSPLHGLHVRASACTVDEYNKMLRMSVIEGGVSVELIEGNDWTLQLFANHLVSWDLEDYITGEPVNTTLEAILSQERGLIAQIIAAWQVAIVSVPKLSRSNSNDGAILAESSLHLGDVSESPGS